VDRHSGALKSHANSGRSSLARNLFVFELDKVLRIRTGETNEEAL